MSNTDLIGVEARHDFTDGSGLYWNNGYPLLKNKLGAPMSSNYAPFNFDAQGSWGSEGFTSSYDFGFQMDEYGNMRHTADLSTFIPANWQDQTVWEHYYVDPVNGANSNTGLSATTAWKTLPYALNTSGAWATTGRVIWVPDDAVFDYGSNGAVTCFSGTVARGDVIILPYSGIAGTGTWTTSMQVGGNTVPWSQDITNDPTGKTWKITYAVTPGSIYGFDFTRIDYQGLPYALQAIAADSKAITGTTGAGVLIQVTIVGHGYLTGDTTTISGVVGNTAANGTWTITYVDANTFSLNGSVGNGAYVSGGTSSNRTATIRSVSNLAQSVASYNNDVYVNLGGAAPSLATMRIYRASTNVTRPSNLTANATAAPFFLMARCIIDGGSKPFGTQTNSAGKRTGKTIFVDCQIKNTGRRLVGAADQNAFIFEENGEVYMLNPTVTGGGKDNLNFRYCNAVVVNPNCSWPGAYSTAKGDYYTSASYGSNQNITPHGADNASNIVSSTDATPIVVTMSSANGPNWTDGTKVTFANHVTNVAANGVRYVKYVTATTYQLYSDAALTTPVAGSGAGAGGATGTGQVGGSSKLLVWGGQCSWGNQNIYPAADTTNSTDATIVVGTYTFNSSGIDGTGKHNGDYGAETNGTRTVLIVVNPKYENPTTGAVSTSQYQLIKSGSGEVDAYYRKTVPTVVRGTISAPSKLVAY
jgi:hypothetical protein